MTLSATLRACSIWDGKVPFSPLPGLQTSQSWLAHPTLALSGHLLGGLSQPVRNRDALMLFWGTDHTGRGHTRIKTAGPKGPQLFALQLFAFPAWTRS